MRRFIALLGLVLALPACAGAGAGSPGGTIAPDTPGTTTPGAPVDLEITCSVFYRPSVEVAPDEGETISLVADGDVARVDRPNLNFVARYFDDEFEGRSLSIGVSEGERGITSNLYQLKRDAAPANDFEGGHGFTGLAYVLSSGGAEMQWFCQARALRDQ
jgi:hypothetical protein